MGLEPGTTMSKNNINENLVWTPQQMYDRTSSIVVLKEAYWVRITAGIRKIYLWLCFIQYTRQTDYITGKVVCLGSFRKKRHKWALCRKHGRAGNKRNQRTSYKFLNQTNKFGMKISVEKNRHRLNLEVEISDQIKAMLTNSNCLISFYIVSILSRLQVFHL